MIEGIKKFHVLKEAFGLDFAALFFDKSKKIKNERHLNKIIKDLFILKSLYDPDQIAAVGLKINQAHPSLIKEELELNSSEHLFAGISSH